MVVIGRSCCAQERHVDQLQRPKHFPEPVLQYTLKELTIVWHLYGGHDFPTPPTHPPSSGSIPHSTDSDSHSASSFNSRAKTSTLGSSTLSSGGPHPLSSGAGSKPSGVCARGGERGGGGKGVERKVPPGGKGGWSGAGGTGRDHSVHMEVEVDKVHMYMIRLLKKYNCV